VQPVPRVERQNAWVESVTTKFLQKVGRTRKKNPIEGKSSPYTLGVGSKSTVLAGSFQEQKKIGGGGKKVTTNVHDGRAFDLTGCQTPLIIRLVIHSESETRVQGE